MFSISQSHPLYLIEGDIAGALVLRAVCRVLAWFAIEAAFSSGPPFL
jgi:hypothetical protein